MCAIWSIGLSKICVNFFFEISSLVYFWFWYFIFYQEKEKKEKNKSKTNAKKTFFVYFFSLSLSFLTFIYLSCWLRKYATGGLRPLIRSLLICSLVYKTSFWQPISLIFLYLWVHPSNKIADHVFFFILYFSGTELGVVSETKSEDVYNKICVG